MSKTWILGFTNKSIHGLSSLVAGKIMQVISTQLAAPNGTTAFPDLSPIGCTVQLLPCQNPSNCGLWIGQLLKVAPFSKYLQYNWLTSCTCTLNWDRIKYFNSENSLGFTQTTSLSRLHSAYFLLTLLTPCVPASYRACSPHATWATAAFKHVSHHNLNKHISFDHTCSQKPPSLWPEGRVERGPRSLAVDNQGHFVLCNIRVVTFSQGVPYP